MLAVNQNKAQGRFSKWLYLLGFIFNVISVNPSYADNTIQEYKGKTYIFDAIENINMCNNLGENKGDELETIKGARFTVERVTDDGDLVITFKEWTLPDIKKDSTKYIVALAKRARYNFIVNPESGKRSISEENDNVKYFLLSKSVFSKSCSEFKKQHNWNVTFGTLTTPFKMRTTPFLFTTNLSLGTSVSYQYHFNKDWTIGGIGGLSLSSVTLDSFSTEGKIKVSTERPALTPSLSILLGYKNIHFTLGLGFDFINRISEIESSWRYNNKPWIGIGIGMNLFKEGSGEKNSTKSDVTQK